MWDERLEMAIDSHLVAFNGVLGPLPDQSPPISFFREETKSRIESAKVMINPRVRTAVCSSNKLEAMSQGMYRN